jgi:mRNA interferase MazF
MTDLRRGSVVFFGDRGEFTGKLRPGIIIQRQSSLDVAASITLCGLTSDPTAGNIARVAISPTSANGLDRPSWVMIDKIASIGRARIRQVFGVLSEDDLSSVDRALRHWLEL